MVTLKTTKYSRGRVRHSSHANIKVFKIYIYLLFIHFKPFLSFICLLLYTTPGFLHLFMVNSIIALLFAIKKKNRQKNLITQCYNQPSVFIYFLYMINQAHVVMLLALECHRHTGKIHTYLSLIHI